MNHSLSAGDQAYYKIKNMIMEQELKMGEKIPEEKIVSYIGGSRTPVREALRRLAAEGLVVLSPRRYAAVSSFDAEDIRRLNMLRLSNDILSFWLAIQNGTDAEFNRLQELADMCAQAANAHRPAERVQLDISFHLYISEIGKNPFLYEQQKNIYQKVQLINISMYTDGGDAQPLNQQHNAIVNSLRSRDFLAARLALRNHLQHFYQLDENMIRDFLG